MGSENRSARVRPGRGTAAIGVALLAVLGMLVSASAAFATYPLDNPGAEADTGSTTGFDNIDVSAWNEKGTLTAVVYGAGGFPTVSDSAAIGGGANFFAGGDVGAVSTAKQKAKVPNSLVPAVDAGGVQATLSGYLGGFAGQGDNTVVKATFKAADGTKLGSVKIGPVTAADRGNVTSLLFRSKNEPVPVGTRSVQVKQTMTRLEGSYNDGYSDNIDLFLSEVF